MPKSCRTCAQPDAELAILAGEPYSVVSKRFGISDDSLRRHMQNHRDAERPIGPAGASEGAELDDWRRFCGQMYDALAAYPKARQIVADRLAKYARNGGKA